jgi:hypothetical protein
MAFTAAALRSAPRLWYRSGMASCARRLSQSSWLLALPLLLLSRPVWAADDAARGAARKLAQAGVEAFQERDYAAASEKLERAYSVLPVPSVALWSARALEKRGKLVEASERYLDATRLESSVGEVAVQRQARVDAETERQALLARIPTLTVSLGGATAEETQVTIDGVAWPSALLGEPRPTNPGEHELRAQRGEQVVTAKVTLQEGSKHDEVLRFDTAPAVAAAPAAVAPTGVAPVSKPGSTQRTLAFVALGVGGAGLIASAITGGMVASRHGDLESSCNDRNECDPARQSDIDSYNSLRGVSTVALVAGGVLAATGVTLLLTAPRQSEHAELLLSGTALRLRGRF